MKPTVLRIAMAALVLAAGPVRAADLRILLPLGRTAYQTNEWIDVSVVRSSADGLKAGPLALTLAGADGSKLDFTFPVQAAEGKPALATENLHLNGRLLRPGTYAVRAAADGATAAANIEVYSHIRKSPFKTIDWASRAAKHEQATLGEDSLGFNTIFYAYGGIDVDEMIRGGLDYLCNCTMGGGQYMDLRRECDWSDPYVLGGGLARLSRQTFKDRVNPNCLGVHFYDEALLAEVKDPADPTGKQLVRYGVPAQERSYKSTFGRDAPKFEQLKFDRPADAERWMQLNRWRLLLLEAAWRIGCYNVNAVRPDYLPINQNQWAWQAFNEGYYFNVNRPFPVTSRHALYDYKPGGDFSPSFAFEFGRARELAKPNWYLPMWGCGHNDLFRAEQYLSFMNNLHGIAKPPDLLVHRPSQTPVAQAIVESNKTMARLGPVFDTLPVTRSDVAVLYSMSHNLREGAGARINSYQGTGHFLRLLYLYLASKALHVPIFPVLDEDVVDGTLARHHKAVLVAGIDYLDPKVAAGLEAFAAGGGAVLVSDDSRVHLKGARPYHFPPDGLKLVEDMNRWAAEKQWDKWSDVVYTHKYFRAALGVAEALAPQLEALGVKPVLECNQPGVIVSRQALGDIEYLFAVNVSPDYETFGWYYLRPVAATLGLPADGRPVYDALRGGGVEQFAQRGDKLTGMFRFGPGQMRVFARTARPIGGVQVLTPLQSADYTAAENPVRVEVNAVLVDNRQQVLCGSAPLQIEVLDPAKAKRYELYRATDRGLLRLTLPLAANDPAGNWTVRVRELLSNTQCTATFTYKPPAQCGALAGATRRAVLFGSDRENVFRFFRTHKELTLVKGSSKYNDAAAERLTHSLVPWDIRCKTIAAAAVKRRELTAQEKPTWVDAGGAFDLRGPVVLLGSPDDNPLIRHLLEQKYLPYTPVRDQFPGRGKGLVAWQREGLAYFGHESLTLIAYDEAGLGEVVGTAYEIAAGMEPLTPRTLPARAAVTPATPADPVPETAVAWRLTLPDRPVAMKALPGGVLVLTDDGTLSLVKAGGAVAWQKTFEGGELWSLDVSRDGRVIALGATHRLHVLDAKGNSLCTFVPAQTTAKEPGKAEGLSSVSVSPDGSRLFTICGGYVSRDAAWQFGSTLSLFNTRGQMLWSQGGLDAKTNKPALPERYHFAAFAADGKQILVLAEKKARVLDAADGHTLAVLDGTAWKMAFPLAEGLLLSEGESKLVLLDPAQGKIVNQLDCAKAGPVTLAPAGPGFVVGSEADGAVRLVKAVTGKLDAQTVWKNQASTKVVKRVAVHDRRVAIIYWGGTLRILDENGKLVGERAFPQDIAGAAWAGGRLVIGLADGEVLALGR